MTQMSDKMSMDILVVGGGGREHAIIKKLKESPDCGKIYCCPGNGGIAADAECHPVKATDIEGMVAFAKEKKVDLVVVAPDDPLVLGMADAMEQAGFLTFGPSQKAAMIEGSKVFSKGLMKKYGIPTATYEVFDDPRKALNYITEKNEFPIVIKADGLALGKGVIIAKSLDEAKDGLHTIMEEKAFTGPEVSVLAFTDSKVVKPMISSMDHKRANDNDEGLNTGGMGTISPNPHYTPELAQQAMERIFLPTIAAMNKEGRPFKGCLYFGLMLTPKGPYVIEYNCRFGDPETQVVLPMLQTDLIAIMKAVANETLGELEIKWRDGACTCVILASGGYPQKYATGKEISGLDEKGQVAGATVYHAGTKAENGKYLTAGGRVLGVSAVGKDLEEALGKSYDCVKKISFENMHYRTDIGRH